jgi:site-specific DNA recombinase
MTSLPFDGYIRVSRVGSREGASFISPAVQRETIERLAATHQLELGEIVEELNVSGGKPIDERELGRLVQKVESGESGGLLVWKVSRFARNLLDGITVATRVRDAGGRIIGSDLDSDAPMGRAIIGLLLGWAEEELDARRSGWLEAQRRAAERGAYPSRTPAGYVRDEDGVLEPDPEVAPAIVDAFRARARGASLGECATLLAEATGRGWSRSAVSSLLRAPVYRGDIVHASGITVEGAVVPLIDDRTWQLAQRDGGPVERTGSVAGKGVLLGLLRCAGCGFRVSLTASGPRGERVASYTCKKHRAAGECPAPASARVDAVDALVLPELERRAPQVDLEGALVDLYDAQVAYAAAERELEEFLAASLISDLGPELYAREVSRRRESLRSTLEEYRAQLDAQDRLASADLTGVEQQREVARRLIESATLHKSTRGRWQPIEERVDIVWRTS